MFCFQNQQRDDCKDLARKLIIVYPWMKDDGFGPAYVSILLLFVRITLF